MREVFNYLFTGNRVLLRPAMICHQDLSQQYLGAETDVPGALIILAGSNSCP